MENKTYTGIEVDFHHMLILENLPWTENAQFDLWPGPSSTLILTLRI